jgi:pyruvate, water dikinase
MPTPFFPRISGLFAARTRQGDLTREAVGERLPISRHSLKMLLSASSRFLSHLTHTRRALREDSLFTMVFVRSQCTSMCVTVFAMIRHLQEITILDQPDLLNAFQSLRARIQLCIAPPPPSQVHDLTMPLNALDRTMSGTVGAKMAFLGEIKQKFSDCSVPEGFVITPAAYNLFLDRNDLRDEINRRLQTLEVRDTADMFRLSSELQILIINSPIPEELQEAIHSAYRGLEARVGHRGVRVAVRSGAVGDDGTATSFAGQFRTELNVSEELLLTAYKEVLASKYSLTAMNYRFFGGLKEEDLPMCVDCLVMVDTRSSGIMYTQDPLSGDSESMFVNGVHGLGKAISDGYFAPDLWILSKSPELRVRDRTISSKSHRFVSFLSEEGVTLVPTLASQRGQPSLSDEQVLELGRLGREMESYFGCALDIEWVLNKSDALFVLQVRPMRRANTPRRIPSGRPADQGEILLRGGQMASPGTATGPAYIVRDNKDLLFFPDGAVLVTSRPHSRWSTLLPKAVAIVTEQSSGIFGHLANIAREFGIPALYDLPDATSILTNGTPITVNASGLTVSRGAGKSQARAVSALRQGFSMTPVFGALQNLMNEIDRLSSMNPLTWRHQTNGSMSLRDIALFCHLSGCRHILQLARYPEFVHPLAVRHPADWGVLDLDDPELGRDQSPEHLDITAHPLLQALWKGIGLAPWPAFTNSPRRHPILRFLRRLRSRSSPLSAPRPRLFLLSAGLAHLYLSLERGFLTIQAHTGDLPEDNAIFVLWQWPSLHRPATSRKDRITEILTSRGFQVDLTDDGLLGWIVGCSGTEITARASFLGFMPALMLTDDPLPPGPPAEIDLPQTQVPPDSQPLDSGSPDLP